MIRSREGVALEPRSPENGRRRARTRKLPRRRPSAPWSSGLLEMRPRLGTERDYDVSTQLEREQIRRRMRSWPADAVRSALDMLLAGPATGRQTFLTAESILDNVYAVKAPAEATVLGMSLLERDPMFRRAARMECRRVVSHRPGCGSPMAGRTGTIRAVGKQRSGRRETQRTP